MATVRSSFGWLSAAFVAAASPPIFGAETFSTPSVMSPVMLRSMNMTRFTTTSRYGTMLSSPVCSSSRIRRRIQISDQS